MPFVSLCDSDCRLLYDSEPPRIGGPSVSLATPFHRRASPSVVSSSVVLVERTCSHWPEAENPAYAARVLSSESR